MCGVWCVVCGVWCVVCGVWCVVRGVCAYVDSPRSGHCLSLDFPSFLTLLASRPQGQHTTVNLYYQQKTHPRLKIMCLLDRRYVCGVWCVVCGVCAYVDSPRSGHCLSLDFPSFLTLLASRPQGQHTHCCAVIGIHDTSIPPCFPHHHPGPHFVSDATPLVCTNLEFFLKGRRGHVVEARPSAHGCQTSGTCVKQRTVNEEKE